VISLQRSQIVAQLVAGELVALGGDHDQLAIRAAQKVDQMTIRRLCGNVGIDQDDGQLQRLAFLQIRLDELGPLSGDFLGDLA